MFTRMDTYSVEDRLRYLEDLWEKHIKAHESNDKNRHKDAAKGSDEQVVSILTDLTAYSYDKMNTFVSLVAGAGYTGYFTTMVACKAIFVPRLFALSMLLMLVSALLFVFYQIKSSIELADIITDGMARLNGDVDMVAKLDKVKESRSSAIYRFALSDRVWRWATVLPAVISVTLLAYGVARYLCGIFSGAIK